VGLLQQPEEALFAYREKPLPVPHFSAISHADIISRARSPLFLLYSSHGDTVNRLRATFGGLVCGRYQQGKKIKSKKVHATLDHALIMAAVHLALFAVTVEHDW
jgi:hypothetical protein